MTAMSPEQLLTVGKKLGKLSLATIFLPPGQCIFSCFGLLGLCGGILSGAQLLTEGYSLFQPCTVHEYEECCPGRECDLHENGHGHCYVESASLNESLLATYLYMQRMKGQ